MSTNSADAIANQAKNEKANRNVASIRDGIGIMLKAVAPDVLPCPHHTRHEWAPPDAHIYSMDPDALFDEFTRRGASFVKKLSFVEEGLWGFSITDADVRLADACMDVAGGVR